MVTNVPVRSLGAQGSDESAWEAAVARSRSPGGMPGELAAALELLRAEIRLGEGRRARLFRPVRGPRRIRFPERRPHETDVRLLFTRDGSTAYARSVSQVGLADLVFCHPMRDFSRRHGQVNKPVAFYSRTVGDLVACESQHERRFVILADWNLDVVHIAAQPFTLEFPLGHDLHSHTPDFVLITRAGGVVVVDVKWPTAAETDEALRRHAAVDQFLARAGMLHAVWSGAPQVVTENLALFSSARVPESAVSLIAPEVLRAAHSGIRIGELVGRASEHARVPAPTVLVVVRRLLWDHALTIDVSRPFDMETTLL